MPMLPRLSAFARASLLSIAALAPSAAAGVTVVDASSPTPVLQAAIDAAPDGEIILVLPGASETNETIKIDGKGLTLVAWPAGSYIEVDRLIIEDVPAGRQVTVRGFTITPQNALGYYLNGPYAALVLDDNAGSVWIEDCLALSPNQSGLEGGGIGDHGAMLTDCASVTMTRCTLIGGRGQQQSVGCGAPGAVAAQPGGSGVSASSSTLALHDCWLEGKAPGSTNSTCPVHADAGHGLVIKDGSHALFAGGTAKGGPSFSFLSASGNALRSEDPASSLAFRLGAVFPGAGSPPSPTVAAWPGTATQYFSFPRQVEVSSPLAEGQPGSLTVTGQWGDLTALFMGFLGGSIPVPGKQGVFAFGTPFFGPFILGTNPNVGGVWTLPFNAPPLNPPVLVGQSFLLQLVVHDGVQASFEGVTTLTLVDGTLP